MILRNEQKEDRHVVAETIVTGKKIKEFTLPYTFACIGFGKTKIPWLPKYFFMRDRPGDTCNRQGK
jgi:hypothetical protein